MGVNEGVKEGSVSGGGFVFEGVKEGGIAVLEGVNVMLAVQEGVMEGV